MREATQTVSSWERKLFIIGHSPVAFVSGGSHTSGSRTSRSPRQAPSRGELFLRARIITDIASRHPSRSMMLFRKPMNCIQNLVQSTEVSPGATLVLLDRPGINSLAAFALASRLNLPGNSMARTNGGCDVWGRENEKTVMCVLCLDTLVVLRLIRVGADDGQFLRHGC